MNGLISTAESVCPFCGVVHSGAVSIHRDDTHAITPGEPSVCGTCGEIGCALDASGALRRATLREMCDWPFQQMWNVIEFSTPIKKRYAEQQAAPKPAPTPPDEPTFNAS